MKKNRIINGLRVLAYIKLMQYKNQVIEIFTHPIKAISAVANILIPLMFMLVPMFISSKNLSIPSINLPLNIIGSVLMLILIVIFFVNLNKAVESYYPTGYSGAEVNFLFTSPLSSRLMYAWSIFGKIFNAFFISFLMIFYIFFMLIILKVKMSTIGIFYSVLGISLFMMVVQNLNFFIYTISKRFNLRNFLNISIKICISTLIIYFLLLLYKSKNILDTAINILGGTAFSQIPVIGWTKSLIMSPFSKEMPILYLLMLVIFVSIMMIITIYFATDFYEEAIVSTERIANLRAASSKNNMDQIQQLSNTKKTKAKKVNINWEFKRAYAFLWKDVVIMSRVSRGPISEIIKHIMYLGIGIGFGFAFNKESFDNIVLIISAFTVMFSANSFQFTGGFEYEIKKSYIFLLPGSARDKLLAINVIPSLKLIIRNLLMLLPLLFLTKITILQDTALWILLNSIQLLNTFTIVTIKVILPFESPKNLIAVYLRMIIQLAAFIPSGGLGFLLWLYTKNIEASLLLFSAGCLLCIFVLLYFNEKIFYRIELK